MATTAAFQASAFQQNSFQIGRLLLRFNAYSPNRAYNSNVPDRELNARVANRSYNAITQEEE